MTRQGAYLKFVSKVVVPMWKNALACLTLGGDMARGERGILESPRWPFGEDTANLGGIGMNPSGAAAIPALQAPI